MAGLPAINKDRSGQTGTFDDAPIALTISIRQSAAKGMEQSPVSDGNKEAVKAAPSPGAKGKTSPDTPAKPAADTTSKKVEATPPYAKESLAGDGWSRAREAARKMHRSK